MKAKVLSYNNLSLYLYKVFPQFVNNYLNKNLIIFIFFIFLNFLFPEG